MEAERVCPALRLANALMSSDLKGSLESDSSVVILIGLKIAIHALFDCICDLSVSSFRSLQVAQ